MRRHRGEGAVFKRTVKRSDGTTYTRWEAVVNVQTSAMKRVRRTVTGKSRAEVLARLDQLKQHVKDETIKGLDLNVKSYLEQWLKHKQDAIRPTTYAEYVRMCGMISQRIGRARMAKIKPLDIQQCIDAIDASHGRAAANKARVVLHSAFNQAVMWQVIATNPVKAVSGLPNQKKKMTLWSGDEVIRFLDAARGHRLYALFYLAVATGLRRGELLGLRWQDIDGNTLYVRQALVKLAGKLEISEPKTANSVRQVALGDDVVEVLRQHRAREANDSDLVFTANNGQPLNPDNLKRLKNQLCDLAGVPQIRIHDFRHLHASLLIRRGHDPKLVADRLGHARASFTLDIYAHVFDDQRKASAVTLGDLLGQAVDKAVNDQPDSGTAEKTHFLLVGAGRIELPTSTVSITQHSVKLED